MNLEGTYNAVLAMIRQYDKAVGDPGCVGRLVRKPANFIRSCDPFYSAAAAVVMTLQQEMDQKMLGGSVRSGLMKLMALGRGRGGPKFFRSGTKFYYGCGFGFVRLQEETKQHPEEIPECKPVVDLFTQALDDMQAGRMTELELPTSGALRRYVTDQRVAGKKGMVNWDFGPVLVWTDLLTDVMQALPGCKAWYNEKDKRQMVYLAAKNGDAVICRALRKEETGWWS